MTSRKSNIDRLLYKLPTVSKQHSHPAGRQPGPPAASSLYVGLMSGTSIDGIDAVLASFSSEPRVKVRRSAFIPFSDALRSLIADLMNDPRRERNIARQVDAELTAQYSQAVLQVAEGCPKNRIRAIGCHGQTILHRPSTRNPFSWQAGDGEMLAQLTGIPVVDDFRSEDMRCGGQGAPLAPAFHQFAFASDDAAVAVVNIGGIANATYLPASGNGAVTGFDTGPGNALSDRWVQTCKGLPFDKDGAWAQSASPDQSLLETFMRDRYFFQAPPKSLDARHFGPDWLRRHLDTSFPELEAAVVQSSLCAFTADSIWHGIRKWMPPVERIVVCGGGAHNRAMMARLRQVSRLEVATTQVYGLSPDYVEACAFAWLAERRVNGIPANLPSVTGASRKVLLGSISCP